MEKSIVCQRRYDLLCKNNKKIHVVIMIIFPNSLDIQSAFLYDYISYLFYRRSS